MMAREAEASLDNIAALIERLQEAFASPKNQARLVRQPRVTFAWEEPIAPSKIFGFDVNRYYSDPLFYVEQTLRNKLWRWEHFPEDDLPIALELPVWLSYYPEYTLLGLGLSFTYEGVPLIQADHPLTRDPDLRLLQPVDFYTSGWMPRILRWYDAIQGIVGDRLEVTFHMMWERGCLDLAIQLRGYEAFLADIIERPQFVHDLLKFLVEQRCRWYEGYERHFGLPHLPQHLSDDWLNVPFISPRIFQEFVLPRYWELEGFHGGITGIHSCGNLTLLQRYLAKIESLPIFEVSPWTDLEASLLDIPMDKKVHVVLHPNDVLVATPEAMEAKLRNIVEACHGRRYSIGTSGLTPLSQDIGAYIAQINTWIDVAHRVLSA